MFCNAIGTRLFSRNIQRLLPKRFKRIPGRILTSLNWNNLLFFTSKKAFIVHLSGIASYIKKEKLFNIYGLEALKKLSGAECISEHS